MKRDLEFEYQMHFLPSEALNLIPGNDSVPSGMCVTFHRNGLYQTKITPNVL